jgi:predicted amidohydrolase YtcJ
LRDGAVVYVGGPIVTRDPAVASPEAVATLDGVIVAVGSADQCRAAAGHDAEVVDLAGRCLLPGFNDAHLHPLPMCFFEHHLDLGSVDSLDSMLDALADRARAADDGDWVLGLQVADEQLVERRLPSLAELDHVGGDRPVVLLRRDGHTAYANSAALDAVGVRVDAVDPAGGVFGRDASGALDGACYESAAQLVLGAVPTPGIEALQDAAARVFARLSAAGITSIGAILQTDAEGPAGAAGALECFGMQVVLDQLPQATHAILCGQLEAVLAARQVPLHEPGAGRRVSGWKVFLDGTLGARTACMHHPYADAPSERGMLTNDPDEVFGRMEAAHLAGLQICVHAIGDAAVSRTLDLFAELLARHPVSDGPPGHRIEHASVLAPGDAEQFGELGIMAAVQPLFLRSEHRWVGDRVGAERLARTYPFRSLLDAGAVLAGSSDAPIEPPDVLAGVHAAVHRFGIAPEQALTVDEALHLYTAGAAETQRRLDETGSLTPGKRADLVVLAEDPRSVAVDLLPAIAVDRTVVAGSVVYERGGS